MKFFRAFTVGWWGAVTAAPADPGSVCISASAPTCVVGDVGPVATLATTPIATVDISSTVHIVCS